ncbi:MAG TPA: TetR/AcrR family transcriptional regulator [Trebonia sp.]|jgi:AcrR family transcriptional regulator
MAQQAPAASIWLRPERAAAGRPARHSRAEITAVAVRIADAEGLEAVSMRRVAAELGTGAASLYRYVETRDELLDLMTDAAAAEYDLSPPSGQAVAGDWLAGLVALGEQARSILRRHRWLAALSLTRPVIGPNAVAFMERYLEILAGHPASLTTKLEAFAMLNGLTATSVLYEQAGGPALQERNVGYLMHAVSSGDRPRLAELFAQGQDAGEAPASAADRFPDVLARVLLGLLGTAPAG